MQSKDNNFFCHQNFWQQYIKYSIQIISCSSLLTFYEVPNVNVVYILTSKMMRIHSFPTHQSAIVACVKCYSRFHFIHALFSKSIVLILTILIKFTLGTSCTFVQNLFSTSLTVHNMQLYLRILVSVFGEFRLKVFVDTFHFQNPTSGWKSMAKIVHGMWAHFVMFSKKKCFPMDISCVHHKKIVCNRWKYVYKYAAVVYANPFLICNLSFIYWIAFA